MKPNPPAPASRPPQPAGKAGIAAFQPILALIQESRSQVLRAVNTALVDLHWRIGEYLCRRIQADGWGQGTVKELAVWLQERDPDLRGFSAQNLWRMRQFFEVYHQDEELSPLVRVLTWTHNLLILNKCKNREERAFYLKLAGQERWGKRDLERQIEGALFERTLTGTPKLSPALRERHPGAGTCFKDRYIVDFLDLPEAHSEQDLQKGLLRHLKHFLLELGRDFCFVGSEYPLVVGSRDFAVDLLFYHRGLQALVAFELKIGPFEPAHLGQLSFYLEALDRDHRKPHEAPSIGVLLCTSRDADVVEYALNRTLSPALVAEYQTRLPDRTLLQAKLEEFYAMLEQDPDPGARFSAP
ncbi:MAG: PDDEXK nuclease domain-containing protein [Holophaga sp.]|nr:PDDEXK nuclease domain-containing protein [Holophaga sp.]